MAVVHMPGQKLAVMNGMFIMIHVITTMNRCKIKAIIRTSAKGQFTALVPAMPEIAGKTLGFALKQWTRHFRNPFPHPYVFRWTAQKEVKLLIFT